MVRSTNVVLLFSMRSTYMFPVRSVQKEDQKGSNPFPTDVAITAWQFPNYHPQSTRVVIDTDTKEVVSLCVNRPTMCGIVEEQNRIAIPFGAVDYMKLMNASFPQLPFPVYAWDIERARGQNRGMFRMERRNDISFFVMHRIILPDEATYQECDVIMEHDEGDPCQVLDGAPSSTSSPPCASSSPVPEESYTKTAVLAQRTNLKRRILGQVDNISTCSSPPKRRPSTKDPARFGLPTTFKGVTYRSRKEARFAVALSELKIPFIYEPMAFSRPSGGKYTPDFFLPSQQLWVELKPERPHLEEELKCEEMSTAGFRIVLMYGDKIETLPFRTEEQAKHESGARDYKHKNGMRGMAWIDGEKLAGETVFVMGASPRKGGSPLERIGNVDQPHLDQVCNTRDMRWNTISISQALSLAGAEKFQ